MSAARLLAVVGMVAVGTPLALPAQTPQTGLVISSDAQLRAVAEALLPDLARRAGLELKAPVRLEMRSRAQLVRYLIKVEGFARSE